MKPKFLERSPYYVFIFAIYPVLFLLSVNINQIKPVSALRSALVFLLLGTLLYFIFLSITKNAQRSAFYATIVLLLFFVIFFSLYAPAYRELRNVELAGTMLGRHRILVPATMILLLLVAACLLFLGRKIPQRSINGISTFCNLIAIFLFAFPLYTILSASIRNNRQMVQTSNTLPPADTVATLPNELPDIYYIIFDMRTNDNVLRNLLDFSDSEFTKALQQRGFFVSECSSSNYNTTQRSVTSSLNMDYLQTLGLGDAEPLALYPALQQNRVRRMLESNGYATYSFEAGYSFVEIKDSGHYSAVTSGILDILIYPGVTSFESLILNVSAGQVLYENRNSLSVKMQAIIDAPYTERRTQVLNTLAGLPRIALENDQPKFVYAHILAPHDPFVFDENGNPVFRSKPYMQNDDSEYDWATYKEPYVNETIYLNNRILQVVDQIIASSSTPPIIILQGDHGIPRTSSSNAHFQILNAYYFPGIASTGLYDTISPVNSFRLLFNNYFGMNYELLKDESYSSRDTLKLVTNLYPCPNN